MNIFLDDERMPSDVKWVKLPTLPKDEEWVIARDYEQFKELVVKAAKPIARVCFDHDLGFGNGRPDATERNGLHCAKLLGEVCVERRWPLPIYVVHSMNPVGKKNIQEYMKWIAKYL